MDISDIKDVTRSSLLWSLVISSPVLSGNMQMNIQMGYGNDGYEIVIEAPFYDFNRWKKEGTIVYTGESKKGFTDYAYWVNEAGGFGSHNKSEGWVNRAIMFVCEDIASRFGGVVEGSL